jgi:hypothetical protein
MQVESPILEWFMDVGMMQARAKSLMAEGFTVLRAFRGEEWSGYSCFRRSGDDEEGFLLELKDLALGVGADPSAVYS